MEAIYRSSRGYGLAASLSSHHMCSHCGQHGNFMLHRSPSLAGQSIRKPTASRRAVGGHELVIQQRVR